MEKKEKKEKQINYSYKLRKNGSVLCNKTPSFYENQNTLRVTYDGDVACKLELVDSKGIVVARADVLKLTPQKRKIADVQRSSGFILNPILFLQRMWEMIQDKTADIVNA